MKQVSLETIKMVKGAKLELTEEEEKLPVTDYILFSSPHPIVPFVKQFGKMTTGHLLQSHLKNPIAYFQTLQSGEVYTVGLVLHNTVANQIRKNISTNQDDLPPLTSQTIKDPHLEVKTKMAGYRVKIKELVQENDCFFVRAIPYEDDKNIPINEKFILNELRSIRLICTTIQKLVALERIQVFTKREDFDPPLKEFSRVETDKYIYRILLEMVDLSAYLKDSINVVIQTILERRSIMERVVFMRKYLQQISSVLEVVNRSLFAADEALIRDYTAQRARMSIDYIKNNYLMYRDLGRGNQTKGAPPVSPVSPNQHVGKDEATMRNSAVDNSEYGSKLWLIPDEVSREKVRKEISRFINLDKYSGEYSKMATYLDEVFSIPWGKYSEDIWDPVFTEKVLNDKLYGLDKVKERIIELVSVNKLKKLSNASEAKKGFVLLLCGPPGTGKTSIARAVAEALQKESRFISFAGVTDAHFIKGHRRTYVDSQPGVFVKELIKCKSMNPVFILDEIDKLSKFNQYHLSCSFVHPLSFSVGR